MPTLLKTTNAGKGRASHYHIGYVNEKSYSGLMSMSAGHTHDVAFALKEGMMPEDISAGWDILPGGKDGHTHEFIDYDVSPSKGEDFDDEMLVQDVLKSYRSARDLEQESVKLGKLCDEYYWGQQWEEKVRKALEDTDRAANTFNLIGKNVDELTGHQRQSRTNIMCLPVEGGDQAVADILNILIKNILDQCGYDAEESAVFLDQSVCGRGNFNIYVDFARNFMGDVVVEQYKWDNVFYGPHVKPDLSDCEELVKYKWYSEIKIKEMFPEKADDLKPTSFAELFDDEKNQQDIVDAGKKDYLLIERWKKIFKTTFVLVNTADDFYFNAEGWRKADITAVKDLGFKAIPVVKTKMRITQVVGDTLVDDKNPAELEYDDFYIIPVYAKKRNNRFKGIVADALDPQDEVNKRHSQSIDIGNKLVSSITYYDDDTFPDALEEKRFKDNASTPGHVQKVSNVEKIPQHKEPPQFPQGIINLLELSGIRLSEIMNIHPEPVGANDSGIALMQKTKMKLLGNEYLFDNLAFAKRKIGKIIIAMIQKYYSVERIMRIITRAAINDKTMLVDGKPLQEYKPEDIKTLLEEKDLTKYDIVISEAQWTPTMRLANLMVLLEMAKTDPNMPKDVLIEFFDQMPKNIKDRLIQGIQQNQAAMQQQEQAKNSVEIQKTLIAAGAKTGGAME